MEIKVGDKVRVSKDAPKLYTRYATMVCGVNNVEDGIAVISPTDKPMVKCIIPTKYLIKVEDEAKEPKFKVSEKVCYNGYVYEIEGLVGKNRYALKGMNFDLDEDMIEPYEPYTEPTAPTIKVGDKVQYLPNNTCGIISKCANNHCVIEFNDGLCCCIALENVELVQTKEQMEACANGTADSCDIPDANNHNFGAIKIPVEVDIQDNFWEAYAASLARDITVKCVGVDVRAPKEIAQYATELAKSVVANLKKEV